MLLLKSDHKLILYPFFLFLCRQQIKLTFEWLCQINVLHINVHSETRIHWMKCFEPVTCLYNMTTKHGLSGDMHLKDLMGSFKSRVLYPGPRFLSNDTWPLMPKNAL